MTIIRWGWIIPLVASIIVGSIAFWMGMPSDSLFGVPGVVLVVYSFFLFGAGISFSRAEGR